MRATLLALAAATGILVAGCATQKTMHPSGGSRSDGMVNMTYEFGWLEKPEVDFASALVAARERCKAWGYADAEPFGGQNNLCLAYNGYGQCIRTQVTVPYQCTTPSDHQAIPSVSYDNKL